MSPAYLPFAVFFPAAAALPIVFFRLPYRWVAALAVTGAAASVLVLVGYAVGAPTLHPLAPFTSSPWEWVAFQDFVVDFRLRLDNLGLAMGLLVSGFGTAIIAYSAQYMEHDDAPRRYFASISLFVTSMLLLVLADNLIVLYMGWEGVGLSSYLLIGHYWKDKGVPDAALKAFIVNRVGDLFFLFGIFLLYRTTGTLNLSEMHLVAGDPRVHLAGLLLLGGACAKSAQIPLHVWLPDAMAGPTPVSALIHAATMVTAGIYLTARLDVLYALSPVSRTVLLSLSLATLVVGSLLALVQTDIKRILAYSTLANLGLMFAALASQKTEAGLGHLFGHASFKAMLFLSAGSVIHFAHHRQEISGLAGVLRSMPVTRIAFWLGAVGSAGVLPFLSSAFFTKEAVVIGVEEGSGSVAHSIVFVCELLSVVYSFRLLGILDGEADEGSARDVKETGLPIRVVLLFLALFALFFGVASAPVGPLSGTVSGFFTGRAPSHAAVHWGHVMGNAVVAALLAGLVYFVFSKQRLRARVGRLNDALLAEKSPFAHAFYFDDANRIVVEGGLRVAGEGALRFLERPIFVGAIRWAGAGARGLGLLVRPLQSGSLERYAWAVVAGLGLCIFAVFYLVK